MGSTNMCKRIYVYRRASAQQPCFYDTMQLQDTITTCSMLRSTSRLFPIIMLRRPARTLVQSHL